MKELVNKIRRKWTKLRLRPIRVFCFHHVSEVRDPLVCQPDDWTQLDQFQRNIEKLQQRYTFISLTEAYDKLQHDIFRYRKYAVLTTDDGLASVLNIQPWLEERNIPLTLFVNTRYMKGDKLKPVHEKWLQELAPEVDSKTIAQKMYLTKEQIWSLNSPLVEIGLHGHNHLDVAQITETQFENDFHLCYGELHDHRRFVSAYAYPWGHATANSLTKLRQYDIIPVLVSGGENYKWNKYIDRECIDDKEL